jgi:hypothetical protein
MGVISFSKQSEQTWQVAGWAFRQVLDDVARLYLNDAEMQEQLELAKLYDALSVYALNQEMATKVVDGIRKVVEGVLAGTIESGICSQPYGDIDTQNQYKSGLRELLLALPDRE